MRYILNLMDHNYLAVHGYYNTDPLLIAIYYCL